MDKIKLFIHIGLPKSGSSFLQQRIFPKLESKGLLNFINVQRAYEPVSQIVYQDPFTFDPTKVRELMIPKFREGINIITVEWFSGVIGYKSFNTLETARRLWTTFPDATIILILRNQVDFAYSSYKQHIHQGGTLAMDDYFNFRDGRLKADFAHDNFHFDDHKIYWNSLHYQHLLRSYQPFVDAGQLKLFLFETFLKDPRVFTKDFFESIGIDVDLAEFDFSPINTGYGKRQIAIARRLNRFVHSQYNQYGFKPIPWFGKSGRVQAVHIRKLLQSSMSFSLLGNTSIRNATLDQQIREYFRQSNHDLQALIPPAQMETFSKHYLHVEKSSY